MRRVLCSILAALVVLLLPAAPAVAASGDQPIPTYTYPYLDRSVELVLATTERGPPALHDQHLTYYDVGHGSDGASLRFGAVAPAPTTTDTISVAATQAAATTTTTGRRVRLADGELSAFSRSDVAANAGDDVVRALSATERRTLDDALRPDKLDHIFDPKHNFQPLVQQFGSREAAMEQIVRSIGGPLPQAGRFEIAQSIGGQTVIIRGAVVDGIPRIGTAFTP